MPPRPQSALAYPQELSWAKEAFSGHQEPAQFCRSSREETSERLTFPMCLPCVNSGLTEPSMHGDSRLHREEAHQAPWA